MKKIKLKNTVKEIILYCNLNINDEKLYWKKIKFFLVQKFETIKNKWPRKKYITNTKNY